MCKIAPCADTVNRKWEIWCPLLVSLFLPLSNGGLMNIESLNVIAAKCIVLFSRAEGSKGT